ncbi:MAG: response regulator [Kofleriaceae bacterium]
MPSTILCLDDDPTLVKLVATWLRDLAADVIAVTDPDDALGILLGRDVAVVIADFEMPKQNGIDFLVKARQLQPETTRILLTGHRTIDTALAGINVGGVFRFLSKPVDRAQLRQAVVDAIAQHDDSVIVVRERRMEARRTALRAALEEEHPAITAVERDGEGRYVAGATLDPIEAEGLAAVAALAIG